MANLILWSAFKADYSPIRPTASYQIASWLRSNGYTVKVIEFCHAMTADELASITEKHIGKDTIAVGVSTTFWQRHAFEFGYMEPEWVVNARDKIEQKYSNLFWLLGGSRVDVEPKKYNWVKFVGFPEDDILRWMDSNTNRYVKRKLFDVTHLEQIMLPEDFVQPNEPLPIEMGRGCKFKCKFCSFPLIGKKPGTYMRDYSLIREDFIRNYNEFGTTRYYINDDTVNEDLEKVETLARIAQSLPFELQWVGFNRLDLIAVNPGMSKLLMDSGLRSAYFGIESFHPHASSVVGKGWNGKYGKEYLLKLREEWGDRINWFLSLIVGLPGESAESIEETSQWCRDNDMPAWGFYNLSISKVPSKLWKSEFEVNAEKYGYSFPRDDNPFYWENSEWTAQSALEYTTEINKTIVPETKPSGWLLAELATHGYSYDQLMKISRKDLPMIDFRNNTRLFIDKYIRFQLDA